jgi:two-component system chemotaxis response regulator CheY
LFDVQIKVISHANKNDKGAQFLFLFSDNTLAREVLKLMGKKILMVDDSRTIRYLVNFSLAKEGFEVIEAGDGEEALSKLQSNTEISLVVSDVNMPKMNGLEMVEAIRKMEQLKLLPIIMLTTESTGDKVEQARKAGANAWLVKPFNDKQLIDVIKKLLR